MLRLVILLKWDDLPEYWGTLCNVELSNFVLFNVYHVTEIKVDEFLDL